MGLLVDGQWQTHNQRLSDDGGKYQRSAAKFRNWITADGSAGASGSAGFKAEPGRYHLYVSLACPWAHRTMILRKLKGLEEMIGLSVVHWFMAENGWSFEEGDGVIADPISSASYIHNVYTRADPEYSGRASVPVLWDKTNRTIVSNESSEIIRMFNSAFDGAGAQPGDYYPEALRAEIDTVNERIYDTLNNGVYRSGFATSQAAYEAAVLPLFDTLDWLEARLGQQRFLVGDQVTEADWRLFPTLVRFDAVYHGHFKCNRRRLVDYSNLWAYTRDLYQHSGVAETVDMDHIRKHYYASQDDVNPTRVVAIGPELDFNAPHGRESLSSEGLLSARSLVLNSD